jgi:hypothetical protein
MIEWKENQRVRINLSQNSKGHIQIDCTAEFGTAEECGEALRKALDEARSVIREKGLTEAGIVQTKES